MAVLVLSQLLVLPSAQIIRIVLMEEDFRLLLGGCKRQHSNPRLSSSILIVDFPDIHGLKLFDERLSNPRIIHGIGGQFRLGSAVATVSLDFRQGAANPLRDPPGIRELTR